MTQKIGNNHLKWSLFHYQRNTNEKNKFPDVFSSKFITYINFYIYNKINNTTLTP